MNLLTIVFSRVNCESKFSFWKWSKMTWYLGAKIQTMKHWARFARKSCKNETFCRIFKHCWSLVLCNFYAKNQKSGFWIRRSQKYWGWFRLKIYWKLLLQFEVTLCLSQKNSFRPKNQSFSWRGCGLEFNVCNVPRCLSFHSWRV